MRLVIAGSRTISITPDRLADIMAAQGVPRPSTVLSGEAQGVDRTGATWALLNGVRLERYPADWNRFGKSAGHRRNRLMANMADALLLVWDGKSPGSAGMKQAATERGLTIYEVIL